MKKLCKITIITALMSLSISAFAIGTNMPTVPDDFLPEHNCMPSNFEGTWVSYGAKRCEIKLNFNGDVVGGNCFKSVNFPVESQLIGGGASKVKPIKGRNRFSFTTKNTSCEFVARLNQKVTLISEPPVSTMGAPSQRLRGTADVTYNGIMSLDHNQMIMTYRQSKHDKGGVVPMFTPKVVVDSYFGDSLQVDTAPIIWTRASGGHYDAYPADPGVSTEGSTGTGVVR